MVNRPTKETLIWRYIGLDKFLDLLLTSTIKFSRASIATDRNEISWILENLKRNPDFEKHSEGAKLFIESLRRTTYISCWVENKDESKSFWASYLDLNKQGVAIKTTVGDFIDSVDWNGKGFDYQKIAYRSDFTIEEIQSQIIAVNTKNPAYKDENEIRFSISGLNELSTPFDSIEKIQENFRQSNNLGNVLSRKVDLSNLISELVISPYCSPWQREIIVRLIQDYQPGISSRITESTIKE